MTDAPRIALGSSDLRVFPLNLGGNVFGWTADEKASFEVLDAYVAAGGNFIDTADVYSAWIPGNSGGESETIIGKWVASRGNRDDVVIATKVGMLEGLQGTSRDIVRKAVEGSLKRLGTDHIDLYYAHQDFTDRPVGEVLVRKAVEGSLKRLGTDHIDLYYAHQDFTDRPVEEAVEALDEQVQLGNVRAIGASNFSGQRLEQALRFSQSEGLSTYAAIQNKYSLVERGDVEGADGGPSVASVALAENVSVLPYFSLASGFLTGKYRDGVEVDSQRAGGAGAYLDDRGRRVLSVLDEVAAAHSASVASVALAWLLAQPSVGAPIASARTVSQLPDLIAAASLTLAADEVAALSSASDVVPA